VEREREGSVEGKERKSAPPQPDSSVLHEHFLNKQSVTLTLCNEQATTEIAPPFSMSSPTQLSKETFSKRIACSDEDSATEKIEEILVETEMEEILESTIENNEADDGEEKREFLSNNKFENAQFVTSTDEAREISIGQHPEEKKIEIEKKLRICHCQCSRSDRHKRKINTLFFC
jgi:hypothetical protein